MIKLKPSGRGTFRKIYPINVLDNQQFFKGSKVVSKSLDWILEVY